MGSRRLRTGIAAPSWARQLGKLRNCACPGGHARRLDGPVDCRGGSAETPPVDPGYSPEQCVEPGVFRDREGGFGWSRHLANWLDLDLEE